MSILLEFSMTPIGKGEGVSEYVSRSIEIIDRSGLPYKTNPMGTVIEGEWEEVFKVVKDCFDRMKADCNRVSVVIKADYRAGRGARIESKVESIERRLGRDIKK